MLSKIPCQSIAVPAAFRAILATIQSAIAVIRATMTHTTWARAKLRRFLFFTAPAKISMAMKPTTGTAKSSMSQK